jgi:hypothetical protein
MINSRVWDKLVAYLRGAIFEQVDGEDCTAIALKLLQTDDSNVLKRWPIAEPAEYGDDEQRGELLSQMVEHAQVECDQMGGTNRYYLSAEYGKRRVVSERSIVFALRSDNADNVEATDKPSEKGVLALCLRHMAENQKAIIALATQGRQSQQDFTELLLGLHVRVLEEHHKQVVYTEELASNVHARKLESKRQEAHENAINELVGSVKPMIPMLLGRITGKPGDAPDPVVHAMRQWVSTLPPGTLTSIVAQLPAAHASVFLSLLQGIDSGKVDAQGLQDALDVIKSQERAAETKAPGAGGDSKH